jgi:hypothetical protein
MSAHSEVMSSARVERVWTLVQPTQPSRLQTMWARALEALSVEQMVLGSLIGGAVLMLIFNLVRAAVRYQFWAWVVR